MISKAQIAREQRALVLLRCQFPTSFGQSIYSGLVIKKNNNKKKGRKESGIGLQVSIASSGCTQLHFLV